MPPRPVERVPPGTRIRLEHHRLEVDGHHVGLSVGGKGVPLVFLHGIGLSRLAYVRVLSRLPHLGFHVIAIDAPGHGHSAGLTAGADDFAARVAFTNRVLDHLGVRRALLVGHSMGGRTAVELAALEPDRALGVVLVDGAVGRHFDASRRDAESRLRTARALATAVYDTARDPFGFQARERARFMLTLAKAAQASIIHPGAFIAAASAIANAADSSAALAAVRDNEVPVAVVHGERDLVVPLRSALDAAAITGATVVTLPRAFHSWVLAHPWTLGWIIDDLVKREQFGAPYRTRLAAAGLDIDDPPAKHARALCKRNSLLARLTPPVEVVGYARPMTRHYAHPFEIRSAVEQ